MAKAPPCVCIDPGRLRHWIDLEQPVKVRDSYGHEIETLWPVFARVRAAIDPARTQDIWQAMQVQTKVTHLVTIRYRSGVHGQMRVRFKGRIFNIVGQPINPQEANVLLELTCCEPG